MAQRRLGEASDLLSRSFERLSSGMRINRASDDPAGLAVSENLRANARLSTQAIRNANDGISLLNVAEGALQSLTNITLRQRELAEQAANGTYSLQQRRALNTEINALVTEFNRIVQSVSFNDIDLFSGSPRDIRLQVGITGSDSISFVLGDKISRTVSDGSFGNLQSNTTGGGGLDSPMIGDFNGDGIIDVALMENTVDKVNIFIGNGDGTFKAKVTYVIGANVSGGVVADLNGDGKQDLIGSFFGGTVGVSFGNGDGTFRAMQQYSAGSNPNALTLADFNGDGISDIATNNFANGSVSVLLGNSNGSFRAPVTYVDTAAASHEITSGDVNGDGIVDLLVTRAANIGIYYGRGDGTFNAMVTLPGGFNQREVKVADLNNDGYDDIALTDFNATDNIVVFLSNGNGTFLGPRTYSVSPGQTDEIAIVDLNGDGYFDLIGSGDTSNIASIMFGNGDGTFKARITTNFVGNYVVTSAADLNGDGALDLLASSNSAFEVRLSNGVDTSTTPYLNINTRQGALNAFSVLDATLNRLTQETGAIGAMQQRLGFAVNNLTSMRENFEAAASRITDIDVAAESAELIRGQILQNAAASVLAQANQIPNLVLLLLKSS